jgi:hypothetical protein
MDYDAMDRALANRFYRQSAWACPAAGGAPRARARPESRAGSAGMTSSTGSGSGPAGRRGMTAEGDEAAVRLLARTLAQRHGLEPGQTRLGVGVLPLRDDEALLWAIRRWPRRDEGR